MKSPEDLMREMRTASDDDEELPPITTVQLDVTDRRGRHYQGTFVYKVPTLGDQVMIGKLKSNYLPAGGAADTNAALLVEQICYLEVCLQFSEQYPRPSWWKPFELYDATPVSALYMEVAAYEARFHGERKVTEAAPQSVRGTEDAGRADAAREPDVGGPVQPPAKRREVVVAHPARSR